MTCRSYYIVIDINKNSMKKSIYNNLLKMIKNTQWLNIKQLSNLVLLIFAIWVFYSTSMNFTILGGIIVILIWIVFSGYNSFQKRSRAPRPNGLFIVGKENVEFALISSLFLIIIGTLSLHTLNNYFYPPEQIYRNLDHHVVRLDGAQILRPVDFVLAEDSKYAFFDSRQMNGRITIASVNDNTLTLRLEGCTRALYYNQYNEGKRCEKRELLNHEQLLHFNDAIYNDTLYMRLTDNRLLKFYSVPIKDSRLFTKPIKNPIKNHQFVFRNRKDSVNYYIQIDNSEPILSSEHRILISGLSLVDILRGVSLPGIDLSGINIVRPLIYPTVANNLKLFEYDSIGYNVEYVQNSHHNVELATVREIYSSSNPTPRYLTIAQDIDIDIEYSNSISLGHPLNSAQHIYFSKDTSNHIFINYRQPKYAYLPSETNDKKFNSTYISTSLNDTESLLYAPDQIVLFDVFEKFDNINSINPFTLSYIAGPTTQYLKIVATSAHLSSDTISTENNSLQYFRDINSIDGRLIWDIGIENLKETSPYKITDIKHNVVILTLALAMLILFGAVRLWGDSEEKQKRNTFTIAEFVMYAAIIYLVTVRLFLLWRVSVFPPTENVSYFEYETLFRSLNNLKKLQIMLIAFVAIISIVKLFLIIYDRPIPTFISKKMLQLCKWLETKKERIKEILGNSIVTYLARLTKSSFYQSGIKKKRKVQSKFYTLLQKNKKKKTVLSSFEEKRRSRLIAVLRWLAKQFKTFFCTITMLVFVVMVIIVFAFSSQPAISITLSILGFICSIAYDNYRLLGHYKLEDQKCTYLSIHHPIAKYFFAVLINVVLYSILLFCIDSGYMILFFTFCVFYLIWLLHEYVTTYMSEESYSIWRDLGVLVLFVLFILLLLFYKEIFNFILNSPNVFLVMVISMIVAATLIYLICMGILKIRSTKFSHPLIFAIILSFVGMVLIVRVYLPELAPHTTNRITVHFKNPEKVLGEKKTEREMQKYMEAALNHMIIGEYEKRADNVSFWGNKGLSYFKMQPHSNVGALWNAQLTDISLVRYCIAEHGKVLPFCVMLLFIILLCVAIRTPLYHRWARSILILIPLLFFIQSLLIWMANTQRFIFLGQDFPMLSINSRLTVLFFFGFSILWLCVVLYEKLHFHKLYDDNDDAYDLRLDNDWRYEVASRDSYKVFVIITLAVLLCPFISLKAKQAENSFEVHNLMKNVRKEIQKTINPLLLQYQNENGGITLQSNMHDDIVKFDSVVGVKEYITKNVTDSSCTNLLINLWDDYVKNGSRNNSSKLVMHARQSNDMVNVGNIKPIQINIAVNYYDKKLPEQNTNEWRGSFVTRAYNQSDAIATQYGDVSTFSIPATWLESSLETVIVKETSMKYKTIVKSDADVAYLARNVRVNGKSTFIYPLGKHFFWIRNFQEQIASQKQNTDIDLRDEHFNNNIEMTISTTLTQNLYNRLSQSNLNQPSVMVANGDGEVIAMVSHDKDFQLDPNDNRTISQIYDSLYMYALNGNKYERRAFANKNLIHLTAGPGSSQKPLLWTAVASAIDFPWKDLAITPYNGNIKTEGKKFLIDIFNTKEFKYKIFSVLKSDERGGTQPVDLASYMTYSSNVYNALMAYIGSFSDLMDIKNINNIDTSSNIFAYSPYSNYTAIPRQYFRDHFPILYNSEQTGKLFTLNKWPNHLTQSNSILEKNMHTMFFEDKHCTKKYYSSTAGATLTNNKIYNTYAYAATSYLHNRENQDIDQFIEDGIRSTAIGAQAVWDVTPWKMTESYGRIVSLCPNYTLSVLKRPKIDYNSYTHLSKGYKDARPIQMKGMSQCVKIGTAKWLNLETTDTSTGEVKYRDYYIYAKTGTTNEDVTHEHHRLGVIISNKSLVTTRINELSTVKFYVVFFATDSRQHDGRWRVYADCLNEIINSKEFLTYMNQ